MRSAWKRLRDNLILAGSKRMSKRTASLHEAVYRFSGGRLGGKIGELKVLLLTTVGRKSGEERTVPLNYLPYKGSYFVIASNSGRDAPPAWFLNLQSNPQATVQVGGRTEKAEARIATIEECARLWPVLTRKAGNYAAYERMTERDIPMVILTPRG